MISSIDQRKEGKLSIAIAGLGFGEKVHIPAIQSSSNIKLHSIWHPRLNRLNEVCKKYSLHGYNNWQELLQETNVQGIIIATPPEQRYQLAIEALNSGKHLLLEKPVGLNFHEVEEIQRLALSNKLTVAVDFEYRAVPLFMQTKRLLINESIGKPWLIKFDWLMSSRANPARHWNWYSDKTTGGGVMGALGTHAFDILHWLIGPAKQVKALLSTAINQRPDIKTGSLRPVTSEDIALIQLELQAKYSTIPAQVTLSSVSRQGRGCWIEIYGEKGTILLGSDNQNDYVHGFGLWMATEGEKPKPVAIDSDLRFSTTWSDGRIAPVARLQSWWTQSIRENKPIVPGLTEALASQKVCDLAKESDHSGLSMDLNTPLFN